MRLASDWNSRDLSFGWHYHILLSPAVFTEGDRCDAQLPIHLAPALLYHSNCCACRMMDSSSLPQPTAAMRHEKPQLPSARYSFNAGLTIWVETPNAAANCGWEAAFNTGQPSDAQIALAEIIGTVLVDGIIQIQKVSRDAVFRNHRKAQSNGDGLRLMQEHWLLRGSAHISHINDISL